MSASVIPAPVPGTTPNRRPTVIRADLTKFKFDDIDRLVLSSKGMDILTSAPVPNKKAFDYLKIVIHGRLPEESEAEARIIKCDWPGHAVSHTGIHPEYGTLSIATDESTPEGQYVIGKLEGLRTLILGFLMSIYDSILAKEYFKPMIPNLTNRQIIVDSKLPTLVRAPKNKDSTFKYTALDVGFCNFTAVPVENGVYSATKDPVDIPHSRLMNKGLELSLSMAFTGVNITATNQVAIKMGMKSAILDNVIPKVSINDQEQAYQEKVSGVAPVIDVLSQLEGMDENEAKTADQQSADIERQLAETLNLNVSVPPLDIPVVEQPVAGQPGSAEYNDILSQLAM